MKKKLDILYEDKNLLILNKPAKVLTIGTDKDKIHNLYFEASMYVKKQHPKNKVFIVNRIDRDTSGIVVFAKNENLKKELQNHWQEWAKNREYIGIVEGAVKENNGLIKNYLIEDKRLFVHETKDSKKGSLAITRYQVIKRTNVYTMLKINIETGRKNQIRVHLKGIGHPLIGDKKYGSLKNPLSRMGLHASKLELYIPILKKRIIVESKVPKEFEKIFD